MAQTGNQCRTWDLTVTADGSVEQETLLRYFDENCSKWVFQKERGEETGYDHYQCRFSLRKKIRFTNLRERLVEELGISGFHLTPTSKNCIRKDEDYYVTKEETRIEGPWRNAVDKTIPELLRSPVLMDWQKTIVTEIENYKEEGRRINVIVNVRGNEGKSFLIKYLVAHQKAYYIAPVNNFKDLMQAMMSMWKEQRAVLIDIPRNMYGEATEQFYSAIEQIKTGILFDYRYRATTRIIESPAVYIFCNHYPDRDNLSWDRWYVRTLDKGELKLTTLFATKKNKHRKYNVFVIILRGQFWDS